MRKSVRSSTNSVELGLFSSRIAAICEEMGALLGRVAFSPNIRDRLDYSCALFNRQGQLLGQATHIPVHLGSMAYAMVDLVESRQWRDGDMLILNDPFKGGTHLPDITLVAPVFSEGDLVGFCANRAHHADIGSDAPGSMPVSNTLDEEGILISPALLMQNSEVENEFLQTILDQLTTPETSRGDFNAQIAANLLGKERLQKLLEDSGLIEFESRERGLQAWAETLVLQSFAEIPNGQYQFEDLLDDDGHGHIDIPIKVTIVVKDDGIEVNFAGTAAQVEGNLNCPMPVTAAAVFYVFRCLMPDHTPACHGAMQGITIRAPRGCLVNAQAPAAVAAGNVETSSRIVDVICGALAQAVPEKVAAASQGTMNNLAMGRRGDKGWDYYETLAGGMGASADGNGRSARHSHMTNTLNTPIEVLELNYPLRVTRYAIRKGSGGEGEFRGGDGVVRQYQFLENAEVSLLTERRRHAPWGLNGGEAGQCGGNELDGDEMPGKIELSVSAGQILTIKTPGGGGFGMTGRRQSQFLQAGEDFPAVDDGAE
ncbi:MAG: hydantoinase B/oxoprolinase family protein [Xanthomonadales bacterium]|nr:hydantoinase B/oxoprolinase family protein [Xanthomonadales bacterium]